MSLGFLGSVKIEVLIHMLPIQHFAKSLQYFSSGDQYQKLKTRIQCWEQMIKPPLGYCHMCVLLSVSF
jgi:hypothetical protein